MAEGRTIELRVKRQDGPGAPPYWQSFTIPWKPQHNVISAL
ncbi:MAG: succinate dehydrogenase iron-sulfur subunit, partial [Deltaproteobacteria bacterium]